MQRKSTLEKLKALGQEIAHDTALAKAEYEQRRRVEKFGFIVPEVTALKDMESDAGTQESVEQPSKSKDHGMER